MFTSALEALGVEPHGAVPVGDLRRSDVAGALAAGMASVRFRGHHDDSKSGTGVVANIFDCAALGCSPTCPRPEADLVIDSYSALGELIASRIASLRRFM